MSDLQKNILLAGGGAILLASAPAKIAITARSALSTAQSIGRGVQSLFVETPDLWNSRVKTLDNSEKGSISFSEAEAEILSGIVTNNDGSTYEVDPNEFIDILNFSSTSKCISAQEVCLGKVSSTTLRVFCSNGNSASYTLTTEGSFVFRGSRSLSGREDRLNIKLFNGLLFNADDLECWIDNEICFSKIGSRSLPSNVKLRCNGYQLSLSSDKVEIGYSGNYFSLNKLGYNYGTVHSFDYSINKSLNSSLFNSD